MKSKKIILLMIFIFISSLFLYGTIFTKDKVLYPIPEHMSVKEKKERFIKILVPIIKDVNIQLHKDYNSVKNIIKNNPHSSKLNKYKKYYKTNNLNELLRRMKPHPISITIAQSAMESAWATSRFFEVANNVFGVWSFDVNEPRIPASQKRGDKTIYVKKYSSIKESIKDYYRTIATKDLFKEFRRVRMKTNNPYTLIKYLDKYSEKGDVYTKELKSMIHYNKFTKYDK